MATCWSCQKRYDVPDLVTRESECPHCAAYLRCCRGCQFYDPNAHNQCREPQAELVSDKEVANTCDYFRLAEEPSAAGGTPQKTKKDLDDLFKD